MERTLKKAHGQSLQSKQSQIKKLFANFWSERGIHCNLWHLFTFPSVHASDEQDGDGQHRNMNSEHGKVQAKISQNFSFNEWDARNVISSESGRERLREMFRVRWSGDLKQRFSPDLELVGKVSTQTFAITFILGSAVAARATKQEFIENNQGEKFKTKFIAHRKMYDTMIKAGLRNGMKYGAKACLITGIFMTVSHSIAVYRNKSSPFEYAAGGAFVMGIWRSYYGLRGMFAGSVIGGVGGLIVGSAIYGMLKAAGVTQEQRHLQALQDEWEKQHVWTNTQQS